MVGERDVLLCVQVGESGAYRQQLWKQNVCRISLACFRLPPGRCLPLLALVSRRH